MILSFGIVKFSFGGNLFMAETEKGKKIHRIYEESKKIIESSMGTDNEFSVFENEQEKMFYVAIRDFFMQQKQKEIVVEEFFSRWNIWLRRIRKGLLESERR